MKMKRFLCVLLAVMCLIPAAVGEGVDTEALGNELDKVFKNHKATGGIVVVAKDGEIVFEHAYGYADKKSREKVTGDHYFNVASVTKFISGIGIMKLVDEGKIDLDASIGDALGFEVYNPYYPEETVSLRHIMSHTTGLSSKGGYSKSGRRLDTILPASLNRKIEWHDRKPGSKYEYSNYAAGLMGSMMEYVTGQNVNDYMTEAVFAPLGMDAAYHPALLQDTSLVTSRYEADGTQYCTRENALLMDWDPSCDPYGHYRITVGKIWIRGRDLCRLGILMLNGGTLDGVKILEPETVAEMMSGQQGKPGVTVDSPYGLCVNRVTTLLEDGTMFYGHQGMNESTCANLYFEPESGFVFAFITNGAIVKQKNRIVGLSRKLFAPCWEAFGAD